MKYLEIAFALLTDEEFGNLLFHRHAGTEVLCGEHAGAFAHDGAG